MKQEGKERTGGTEERRATTVVRLEGKDARPLLRQRGRREDVERLRFPQNGCFNGPLQSSRAVPVCVRACSCACVLVRVRKRGYSIYSSLSVIEFLKVWLTRNHDTKHFSLSLPVSHTATGSHVYVRWRARLSQVTLTRAWGGRGRRRRQTALRGNPLV